MKVAVYEIKPHTVPEPTTEFLFEYELDGLKPIPAVGEYVNCGEYTRNLSMKVHSKEFKFLFDTIEIYLVS